MHKKERANNGIDIFYNTEIANLHIANWLKDAKKRFENEELRRRDKEKWDNERNRNVEDDENV